MLHHFITTLLLLLSIEGFEQNTYTVRHVSPGTISVDGKAEQAWLQVDSITTFVSPWKNVTPEPTSFRAAHDDNFLYFFFSVSDGKIIGPTDTNEASVTKGDRVELFFSADSTLEIYYCFEIAPNGLIYDYKAKFHRNFFPEWQSSGVIIKTIANDLGYSIEGAIPMAFFADLLSKSNSIYAGIFRAECDILTSSEDDFTWLSWIQPKSIRPDFHIPSAMGVFKFE